MLVEYNLLFNPPTMANVCNSLIFIRYNKLDLLLILCQYMSANLFSDLESIPNGHL